MVSPGPTIEEVDPFYSASMAHNLGTVSHDPYCIGFQLSVSHLRSISTVMRTENYLATVVKLNVFKILPVNITQGKTLEELNNQIHFTIRSIS